MIAGARVQKLGAYQLGDRLGVGGMAEVFAGAHDKFGRVAVKRILPGLLEDAEFGDMFWDEARITSRLDHPNIVRVLDYGRVDGQLYMALEYVDGPTLARVLRKAAKERKPLSYPALLTIATQLLDALHYVHRASDDRGRPLAIVHRDVSPGNIMMTSTGAAKLGDFGIVRSQAVVRRTQPGELKGKIGYMSPEQAMGEQVTRQSDLFSVGIVLAEFLTLRPLFLGKNEMQTLSRTVNVDLSTWHRHNADVPMALRSIVEKALNRDLGQRFSTAGEMRDALIEVARAKGWVMDSKVVADELMDLELLERPQELSGERPVTHARGEIRLEEIPTMVQDLGGQRRFQGKPVWDVAFSAKNLPAQLFLALRRARTGALELSAGGASLIVELHSGVVSGTHDSTGHAALGRLLVEAQLIAAGELVQAIGESRRAKMRLGEFLVLQGKLRQSVLLRMLRRQLEERLGPWMDRDDGRLAVYASQTVASTALDPAATPASYAEIVGAMRASWTEAKLEEALRSVWDAIVLPASGHSVVDFGLTEPEVRALSTALEGGAYEGYSLKSLVDNVQNERIARRRETMFALFIGLSAGIIQAPGFGRS